MMGPQKPCHILTCCPLFHKKLVNWGREQPRDRPDQQDQAQGGHGRHGSLGPAPPGCNHKFRCHKDSHQWEDATDVPLKVDHARTILVQIGKQGVMDR